MIAYLLGRLSPSFLEYWPPSLVNLFTRLRMAEYCPQTPTPVRISRCYRLPADAGGSRFESRSDVVLASQLSVSPSLLLDPVAAATPKTTRLATPRR
ncbi:unnamed protein product [Dibothriocephalus latus]|uniref:Uncharacterized protein n=1 Tax=Dibothriocephalus latus TaxID=60516 RepID=A0A3P7L5P6_DIBLA|nr:unnamed protein product [Dibothriocephalus latus]